MAHDSGDLGGVLTRHMQVRRQGAQHEVPVRQGRRSPGSGPQLGQVAPGQECAGGNGRISPAGPSCQASPDGLPEGCRGWREDQLGFGREPISASRRCRAGLRSACLSDPEFLAGCRDAESGAETGLSRPHPRTCSRDPPRNLRWTADGGSGRDATASMEDPGDSGRILGDGSHQGFLHGFDGVLRSRCGAGGRRKQGLSRLGLLPSRTSWYRVCETLSGSRPSLEQARSHPVLNLAGLR